MVGENHGNREDAEDVFQLGLLALLKYCARETLHLEIPLVMFLYSVCRKIWWKEFGKRTRLKVTFQDVWEYIDLDLPIDPEDDDDPIEEQLLLLWKYLDRLPKRAQQLLVSFYRDGKSYGEIAKEMNYSGAASARQQSFKYIRKLRKLMLKDRNRK